MRILLGVTAGIAAYKVPFLIRLLVKQGAEVRCVMTPDARDFVSPLVLSTLSNHPVSIEFWNKETGAWNNHVALAEWADLLVICPCTANTLSKMASGACDNLLLAIFLSMRNKTILFPAMDLEMYRHPTVQRNMDQLQQDGSIIVPAEYGELASGLSGQGRLPEPETLLEHILGVVASKRDFLGKTVVVTAGPTYEAIDPVRFIGNHASGKMGVALAERLAERGADVLLVLGPSKCSVSHPKIKVCSVVSAEEMWNEVKNNWDSMDFGFFAAAVADYQPEHASQHKIKKSAGESMALTLVKTPDILAWAGKHKKEHQQIIGFALETQNGEENAKEKLHTKKADFMVLNVPIENESGFNAETNKVCIFGKDDRLWDIPLMQKREVANAILNVITNTQ
ncbi:MAG: bifunctional phosphopantothenoylcysteine decarboxylase/phosphopantothenate--cysteine ligase CoaBC [Crocinitomicaceae bacterium]